MAASEGVNGQERVRLEAKRPVQGSCPLLEKEAHVVSVDGMNTEAVIFLMQSWQGLCLDMCTAEDVPRPGRPGPTVTPPFICLRRAILSVNPHHYG